MPAPAIPNVNCLWGAVVAGTLARLGLKHAVLAPGSRSAPLTWAFARQKEIQSLSVLDERSAAFYALGLAKASGQPVALVCTSGTAVANFFPAIIEASLSAVPLLVLTADRPPELRDCHAGQAIDQVKIYGHYPRWQHEMALPENNPKLLRYLRQTMVHAWDRSQNQWPGPVHLNFPFREPLAPVKQSGFKAPTVKHLEKLLDIFEPHRGASASHDVEFFASAEQIFGARRGVIVVGPGQLADREIHLRRLYDWARQCGWPILADSLSPLRSSVGLGGQMIAHYDLILRAEKKYARLQPEVVIQLGSLPTSKKLRTWLDGLDVPVLVVNHGPENADPLHRQAIHWRGKGALLALLNRDPPPSNAKYAKHWARLEKLASMSCANAFLKMDWLFEGKTAWTLSRALSMGTPVFVASSMPVRDCEYFWEAGGGQRIYFNRGANGIDGTLSTALGIAHAMRRPTVLYTGDLALLHDQNGFLAARELPAGASLTIVLINNNGSGIFEHLPISKFDPPFERFFATPQNIDFEKLAALYGLDYRRPATWPDFTQALLPLPTRGVRLIEVRTDRKRDAAFRSQLFHQIAATL